MLIRFLPKCESAIISALCSPSFHSRHRCRTSCGFPRMTQRLRRTWRRSGGPTDSSVSTVGGMPSPAVSRTAPPSCFDVAGASVTRRLRPTRSCRAPTRRSRSGFGPVYLVSSQTPSMSAVQFQRQLGLKRYETAFQILHKLVWRWCAPIVTASEVTFRSRSTRRGSVAARAARGVDGTIRRWWWARSRSESAKRTRRNGTPRKALPRRGGLYTLGACVSASLLIARRNHWRAS